MYKTLRFVSFWLYAFASIGIFFLAEDVVTAMTGSTEYILDKSILIVSLINFYIQGILQPNATFRQTTGLFKMAKYSMLICALLNLVIAIILGNLYGLVGIVLAMVLSRLLTNAWYEPYLLFKKFFGRNPIEYYKSEIIKVLLCISIIVILSPLMNLITINNLYIKIIVKLIICCIIPNLFFITIFKKTKEFNYIFKKVITIFPDSVKEKVYRILKLDKCE